LETSPSTQRCSKFLSRRVLISAVNWETVKIGREDIDIGFRNQDTGISSQDTGFRIQESGGNPLFLAPDS
jgi:hypothetical protein